MNLKRRLTVEQIIHNAAVNEFRDDVFEKRIRQGAAILFVLAIIWAMDSSAILAVIGFSLAIVAAFVLFFCWIIRVAFRL